MTVLAYFENGCSANHAGIYRDEEEYNLYIPELERQARKQGEFLTESVDEMDAHTKQLLRTGDRELLAEIIFFSDSDGELVEQLFPHTTLKFVELDESVKKKYYKLAWQLQTLCDNDVISSDY